MYLENFPVENAGYQYRTQKWAEILNQDGYEVDIWTLYPEKSDFDEKRKVKPFSRFLIKALWIRFFQVWKSRRYETIIIRRELLFFNDYGDLFLEKWLLKMHPDAILDFDDDIAAAKRQPKKITNWYARLMKENGNKFNQTIAMYKRFIVASNYLKERVITTNPSINEKQIAVIPTCVDYGKYPPKEYPEKIEEITLGWIGGDHNYPQLRRIIPVLNELYQEFDFKLIVIGGSKFEPKTQFELVFIPWSFETQINNLYNLDVGLMPLEETQVTKGKGGFKLIQYMGLGIVGLASSITINQEIVEDGVNSFLVKNDDWKKSLTTVFNSVHKFGVIGKQARSTILKKYSFIANKENYIALIKGSL